MTISKTTDGDMLTIAVTGRLDSLTAPKLEAALKGALGGVQELVFDFAGLEYVSSAGLRVLLAAQKTMDRQGRMVVRNVCQTIIEVLEVTGFIDILKVE